jgi:chemotaxis protein MotC
LLSLWLILAGAPVAVAAEPWEYLRAYENLQERIARGDRRALKSLPAYQRFLYRRFRRYPPAVWKRPRNAEAIFVWLLSGGPPRLGEWMLRERIEVALPEGALEGAVAHARGYNVRAWRHLSKVPPEALGRVARAQLLLAKASLRGVANPREALAMLARARLLMPGTLLEEAALRRGIWLAGMEADVETLIGLAGRYIRRFGRSGYAEDFLRRLSFLLVRLDIGVRPTPLERLEPVLPRLSRRKQALLHAAVARQAVIDGRLELAAMAAGRALGLYPNVERFAARVRLYRDAAQVARPDPEAILADLAALRARLLGARDRYLLHAATAVGEAIMAEPAGPVETTALKRKDSPPAPPSGKLRTSKPEENVTTEQPAGSAVLARADALARDIERLLQAY